MLGNLCTKIYLKWIERKGFQHGRNFDIEKGANIDSGFCKFISCGDNVTITKDVYILAHDASMKKKLGKTKVGKVIIGMMFLSVLRRWFCPVCILVIMLSLEPIVQ